MSSVKEKKTEVIKHCRLYKNKHKKLLFHIKKKETDEIDKI